MRFILYILLLLLPICGFAEGLQFRHAPNVKDLRCRYEVFSHRHPSFEDSINIQFELNIPIVNTIGNIVRFKLSPDRNAMNLVFAYDDPNYSDIKLNIEKERNLLAVKIDNSTLSDGEWMKIAINCNFAEQRITLKVNDTEYVADNVEFDKVTKPEIIFGCNKPSDDAAHFSIRNLAIFNDKTDFRFALDQREGSTVWDDDNRACGSVENPEWIIHNSYYWDPVFSYRLSDNGGVCTTDDNHVCMVTRDTLFKFSLDEKELSKHTYVNRCPINISLGTCFYNRADGSIYVYEVNNQPSDSTTVAKLNLESMEWQSLSRESLLKQRHHHTLFACHDGSSFCIFGGFGNRTYSNQVTQYSLLDNSWSDIPFRGDVITPRFFTSSIVESDSSILIWGGKGNISGDQTLGAECYYDLHRINLEDNRVEKLWELSDSVRLLTPVRDGILASDAKSFYTLCYNVELPLSPLQLYEVGIADGSYRAVGNTVEIRSDNILNNANIVLNKNRSKIYCYIQEFEEDIASVVKLYSVNNPPISLEELTVKRGSSNKFTLVFIIIGVILVVLVFILRRRAIARGLNEASPDGDHEVGLSQNSGGTAANSIYLIGEFKVYDNKGFDISHLFSKKIQQLFLLIFLKSVGEEGGVSSSEIGAKLWADKDESSGKNIRGVTMNHLRRILNDVDGVDIVYQKGLFRCVTDERLACDYISYHNAIGECASGENVESNNAALQTILSRGKFLVNINDAIFDKSKHRFEEQVLTYATLQISNCYKVGDYKDIFQHCTLISHVDEINEFGLWYELDALIKLNKREKSVKRFYAFSFKYKSIMGEEYPKSYEQFIDEKRYLV